MILEGMPDDLFQILLKYSFFVYSKKRDIYLTIH